MPTDESARAEYLDRVLVNSKGNALSTPENWGIAERLAAWGLVIERQLEGSTSGRLSTVRIWSLCQTWCDEMGETKLLNFESRRASLAAMQVIEKHLRKLTR